MRSQPFTKVVPSHVDSTIRLVTRIDLGVDDMRVDEQVGQESMDMSRERAEGLVVPEEAMEVNDEQLAPTLVISSGCLWVGFPQRGFRGVHGEEGLRGGGAGIGS